MAQRGQMEPVTSKGVPKKTPKMASANRVFRITGPKVPVSNVSGLSPAKGLRIVNGD